MAKYLVPWSGGLDSTYLIFKLLSEGHHVEAICWHMNTGVFDQDVRQKRAIEEMTPIIHKLCREMYNRNSWFSVEHISNEEMGYPFTNRDYYGLGQAPSIISALARRTDNETDFAAIGYVIGDDALSFLDEITALYNAFTGLRLSTQKEPPQLVFPLMKLSKYAIYGLLPDDLKDKVTWCESHNKIKTKGCGTCVSCLKMKRYHPDLFPNRSRKKSFEKKDLLLIDKGK